jgi:hypothetical protein
MYHRRTADRNDKVERSARRIPNLLTGREFKRYNAEFQAINHHLEKQNFDGLMAELALVNEKGRALLAARAQTEDSAAIENITGQLMVLQARRERLATALLPLKRYYARYLELHQILMYHSYAYARQLKENELNKGLGQEADEYAEAIPERLGRMGYQHSYRDKKNRWRVDRVYFDEVHTTPQAIYLKLAISAKALFGTRSCLPYGVKVREIISEETLEELSYALQRQVTVKIGKDRSVWYVVHRLGTTDGLINYVTLEQCLNSYDLENHEKLPIPVGVGQGNQIEWLKLAEHPHLLVGGSTGGGKSNLINIILCTLIQRHSPERVRFVLVDLKDGLEFQHFERIPHLLCPVVTELEAAAQTFGKIEKLRRERSQELARAGVKDIDEYNKLDGVKPMSRIIAVFDEYAAIQIDRDLADAVQRTVMQLLNKGRAAGIHLIISTQNPSVDIIPGVSKNNITARISTPMPTKAASMTILGVGDAAELPNKKGRIILMIGARLLRLQAPHVRKTELETSLKIAADWHKEPLAMLQELPSEAAKVVFDEQELLRVAIKELGCNLGVRPIHDHIKEQIKVSRSVVEQMVAAIIERGEVEFEGEQFRVVSAGRGKAFKLEIQLKSEAGETSTAA